jgi:hypothetical protein
MPGLFRHHAGGRTPLCRPVLLSNRCVPDNLEASCGYLLTDCRPLLWQSPLPRSVLSTACLLVFRLDFALRPATESGSCAVRFTLQRVAPNRNAKPPTNPPAPSRRPWPIQIPYLDHRIRRKPHRLIANAPIETARRHIGRLSSHTGSPDRNLTFTRTYAVLPLHPLDQCSGGPLNCG